MARARLTGREVDDVLAGRRPDARAGTDDLVELMAVLHASRELEPPPPLSPELREQIARSPVLDDLVVRTGELPETVLTSLPNGVEAIRPARPPCYRRPVASLGVAAALLVGVVLATAGDQGTGRAGDTVSGIGAADEGGPLDHGTGERPAPTTTEAGHGPSTSLPGTPDGAGAGGTGASVPDAPESDGGSADRATTGEGSRDPGDGDRDDHGDGGHDRGWDRDRHRDGDRWGGWSRWFEPRGGSRDDSRDGSWEGSRDEDRGDRDGGDRSSGDGTSGDGRHDDGGDRDGEAPAGDGDATSTTSTTSTTRGTTTTTAAVEPQGDAVVETGVGRTPARQFKPGTPVTSTTTSDRGRYSAQHSVERNRHPADGWGWFPRRLTPGGRAGPFGG